MHSHQLNLRVDLRDVQLFSDLLSDRQHVGDRFLREHSDFWSFLGNEESCEELQCEVEDLLRDVEWLGVEFELVRL